MNEIEMNVKVVEAEMNNKQEPVTLKDPPPAAVASYVVDDDGKQKDGLMASKTDIAFMPGTATIVYGDQGDDVDDKVAQKMMKEDELKKYHKSFMKDTPPKFFDGDDTKDKRDFYLVWMVLLTLVFIGLLVFGFVSGLFLPNGDDTPSQPLTPTLSYAERQAYMEELMGFLQLGPLEPSSPQEQAIEWMSFQDDPLPVPSIAISGNALDGDAMYQGVRLEQRYALTVWYFAQGGPKLWSTINRDMSSGWMNHGIGVHECDWHGVDCEKLKEQFAASLEDARVVVALRLTNAVGVVLTGTSLSTELGMLTHLRRLDFSDQRLEGSIPDEWNALTNLEMLALSKNVIQGNIPTWIGESWPKLKTLAIDGNLMQGSLPASLMTMTNLRHLELQLNNNLSGQFDEVMKAIPALEYFDFSKTELGGTIPTEPMSELRVFKAWNTEKLEGTIPTEIGNWNNLETFSLDANPMLKGSIPTTLGLLSNLQTLQIRSAAITGPLPTELGGLPKLKSMVLSIIQLDSTLPLEYANLSTLEKMDFLVNYGLTGTIPTEYANIVNLSYFDVAATSLTGSVPSEVCALELDWMTADCPGKNFNANDMICDCCTSCGGGAGRL